MSKSETIRHLFDQYGHLTNQQIANITGYKRGTISSALSRLNAKGTIERESRGKYNDTTNNTNFDWDQIEQFEQQYHRYYASGVTYTKGKKQTEYIITYSDEPAELEFDFLSKLESNVDPNVSSELRNFAFSHDLVDASEIDSSAIYPDIKAGLE